MLLLSLLLPLGLVGLSGATPLERRQYPTEYPTEYPTQNQTIQWGPCSAAEVDPTSTATVTYECGTFEVPLDHSSPLNSSTFDLQIARIPATQQPSRGSVFFNPGGPGVVARSALISVGPRLIEYTGGVYDLIAIDSRGTGTTLTFNCTNDDVELWEMLANVNLDRSDAANYAFAKQTGSICAAQHQDIGRFLTTADVVEDMMSVVDVLEDDGMLRFFGTSYGTTLGQTAAAMYPDRMDKLLLDSVQDVQEYYEELHTPNQWADSDALFSAIWSTCLTAGPELCPLASSNHSTSAATLESAIWTLVDSTRDYPIVIQGTNATTGGPITVVIDEIALTSYLALIQYNPIDWPEAAETMRLLLAGERGQEVLDVLHGSLTLPSSALLADSVTSMALAGIQCGDARARVEEFEELLPTIEESRNNSRLRGDLALNMVLVCASWQFQGANRWEGSWDGVIDTANPILFTGNSLDGLTAIGSAYVASGRFAGSRVFEVDGYGHGMINSVSACAARTAAAYFVDGMLPEEGLVCPIEVQPYEVPVPGAA